ncbi:Histone acetyltransferase, partial [Teratosphaeriaceae sp. CCFEE 6253]
GRKTPPLALITPQPSVIEKESGSPTRRQSPRRKTPNGRQSGTRSPSRGPQPEEQTDSQPPSQQQPTADDAIPPERFEIFPPVPGMAAAKRRTARPGRGGNRRSTYGTPVRRSANGRARGGELGSATLRRTRSKLGDLALSAADLDEDVGKGEMEMGGEDGEGDADAPAEDDDEIRYE